MNTFPMPNSPQKCSRLVKNNKRVTARKIEVVEGRVLGFFQKSKHILSYFPLPNIWGAIETFQSKMNTG